jgi:hypothetical protein
MPSSFLIRLPQDGLSEMMPNVGVFGSLSVRGRKTRRRKVQAAKGHDDDKDEEEL